MHAIAATPNMQVLHLHHLRQLSTIPGNLELHTSALVECRPETPQFFANDASMGSRKRSQLPGNTAFRVSVVFRMRPIIVWKESTRDISKTALNSFTSDYRGTVVAKCCKEPSQNRLQGVHAYFRTIQGSQSAS